MIATSSEIISQTPVSSVPMIMLVCLVYAGIAIALSRYFAKQNRDDLKLAGMGCLFLGTAFGLPIVMAAFAGTAMGPKAFLRSVLFGFLFLAGAGIIRAKTGRWTVD